MAELRGTCARGFERVRDAFGACFGQHAEVGAAVCVYLDGEPVVDLWGGYADREQRTPWQRDTLALVFSATKGVTAACVHRLAEQGKLDLDAPVASYWPEFAAAGKAEIPLRWVLTHRAGLADVKGTLTLEQVLAWDPVCAAIAAQPPHWEPGTRHGYHARSYGWILGEVVRRVCGRTLGQFFAEEFAAPLGLDFFIGLPEEHEPRVATLYPAPEPTDPEQLALRERFMGPDTLLGRVLSGPSGLFNYGPMWNARPLHAAEMPSSNGIGSARALARFYASLIGEIDGFRGLRPETLAAAVREQVAGPDAVILVPTRFGSGFMLAPTLSPGCAESCFGHPGAGGSLGFADPEARIAFGYVLNQMQLGMTADARAQCLVEAVYACRP
ncbi:MAG: serine hydrolase [Deltaproteobacteria bacterium]|nr:serine hydrolase [Deltaproteobacteria bacterium]